MKHSLKTAALSFGVAVLFGSVAVGFAQTSDTTESSHQSSETTTSPSAPPAVVYPAPVVVAPPAPVVMVPAPAVVVAPAPVVVEPSTTTKHSSENSESNSTTH